MITLPEMRDDKSYDGNNVAAPEDQFIPCFGRLSLTTESNTCKHGDNDTSCFRETISWGLLRVHVPVLQNNIPIAQHHVVYTGDTFELLEHPRPDLVS